MKRFERRADGSMLEEVGGKNGGGRSGQVQGRGQRKGGIQRQRLPAGMEVRTKKKNTGYESGEKTAWQESSPCAENTTCGVCQSMHKEPTEGEEMKRQERMKIMKGYDEEDQIKRKDGCRELMVLVEPLQCCCTVGHITACCSRLDTDMLLTLRRPWA